MNAKTEVVAKSATGSKANWDIVRIAAFLMLTVQVSTFVYTTFFALTVADSFIWFLSDQGVADVEGVQAVFLGLTLLPVQLAILTAVCPLIGWWIYSKIDKADHGRVGWGAAGLFAVANFGIVLLSTLFGGGGLDYLLPMLAINGVFALVLVFYIMFFQGIGFVLSALLHAKL